MQRRSLHLRNGGTSVVLDLTTDGLPTIVHWGTDLGDLAPDALDGLALGAVPQRVSGGIDVPARLTLLPQDAFGWQGTPGLDGHRAGRSFSSALVLADLAADDRTATVTARDDVAGLELVVELAVTDAGLLTQRLVLTNLADTDYELLALTPSFPLPATATEILDTTGRHLRERSPQRRDLTVGTHLRESRKGRPGADASVLLAVGERGFAFESGLVHAVHVAWSGNHRLAAERTITAESVLQGGELLLAGELVLAPGESYATPVVLGSWGEGLNALSARFHADVRARAVHPTRPRPVTLNTWEAVYFDHDLATLTALAERAARVGVERFVLDDGWFLGRRDDTAGLGDWTVDADVWPQGLGPIVATVRDLGMEFGLWFEPEMVNPDSDLARAHPDWLLQPGGRLPVSARQQQVLNLAVPEAFEHILARIDALVGEYGIAYIKWDHNRDLLGAGDARTGRGTVHEHTLAVYRLLDTLKERHPDLEIESCASGGARVDLGILARTDRVWTSDCIDPIERLDNQRYTGLLLPPELMGAHIGGPHSHSTHRSHELALRAGVAFFHHLGIEWDISTISDAEEAELTRWVSAHKAARSLAHTGRTIHADLPDAAMDLRGVVAADGSRALFALTQRATTLTSPPGRVHLPGLDPQRTYTVRLAEPMDAVPGPGQSELVWARHGMTTTGRALGSAGLQAPALYPEQLVLLDVRATT